MPARPRSPLAWSVMVVLLAASLVPGGADADEVVTLVVPEGTVAILPPVLRVDVLEVFGTLRAGQPGDVAIHAALVHVGRGGSIEALPGAAGADATGLLAVAGDGAPGGAIAIVTGHLAVDAGGWILAGPGGPGGSATSPYQAVGGAGGRGGDLLVTAATTAVEGHALPGAGGHGGPAASESDGTQGRLPFAAGGDAGDAGDVRLNGGDGAGLLNAPVAELPDAALPRPAAAPQSTTVHCMVQGHPGVVNGGLPDVGGAPDFGNGGWACAVIESSDGLDGQDCTTDRPVVTPGGPSEQVTTSAAGGSGGAGPLGGGFGGAANAISITGDGGAGGDGSACGLPGASGGASGSAAAVATGGAGGDALLFTVGILGNGGAGGAAFAVAVCGRGGDGGSGSVAVLTGGAGGAGGGCSAEAVAGYGGNGRIGGAGGAANANAVGGDGGAGGSPGGGGGNAGSTHAASVAGDGGRSCMGSPQALGGTALEGHDPGEGGAGPGGGGDDGDDLGSSRRNGAPGAQVPCGSCVVEQVEQLLD